MPSAAPPTSGYDKRAIVYELRRRVLPISGTAVDPSDGWDEHMAEQSDEGYDVILRVVAGGRGQSQFNGFHCARD